MRAAANPVSLAPGGPLRGGAGEGPVLTPGTDKGTHGTRGLCLRAEVLTVGEEGENGRRAGKVTLGSGRSKVGIVYRPCDRLCQKSTPIYGEITKNKEIEQGS